MMEELVEQGWALLHGTQQSNPVQYVVESLSNISAPITRDVQIGSSGCAGDLLASRDEFEFHTDGVFWALPPRWVCIELLRADSGGALHILDLRPIAEVLSAVGRVFFGRESVGIVGEMLERFDTCQVLRYRRDYTIPLSEPDATKLENAVNSVAIHAAAHAVVVGELSLGDCLITDNWRIAHRREAFRGERLIRRLWIGGREKR
jgi:hypothetical protein